ncbi:MAG: adenine-specific methyltransferase EcoRI family protein [Clostridia bacterium]|nr:adenine-specific methyltransferase EcoRI family protein [Clostridia bacterium]
MADNSSLHRASRAKNDEFYTQLVDIEQELNHYKQHFKGKTVFCNCDDPFESNFFKYFAMNFNHLGLKKLICTCYRQSPIAWAQLSLFENEYVIVKTEGGKDPYKIEINEVADYNCDGAVDLADVKWLLQNDKNSLSVLQGDGDFRSEECIELLKEADIVVTNPPFSLFREYVAQLMEYNKEFIIIGNKNSITYKEIFPLFSQDRIWLGYRNINADMWLVVPDDRDCEKIVDGKRLKHIMACWFTNLPTTKRSEFLPLYKRYNPDEYPKYDNYDAINVDKVSDIPYDYDGVMGVPITFLDKYNPDQFEIVAFRKGDDGKDLVYSLSNGGGLVSHTSAYLYDDVIRPIINGRKIYRRITIRKIFHGNSGND